jgi:hypothetical protein
VRTLFDDVVEAYRETHQLPDLSMPWLNGFRERFQAVDTDTLAHAARAAYFYGHWGFRNECMALSGGTWKFSALADQELSERLGLPQPHVESPRSGWSRRVMQGTLRVGYSAWDFWTREEAVAYASADALHESMSYASGDGSYDAVTAALQGLRARLAPQGEDSYALLFNTDRYMETKEDAS